MRVLPGAEIVRPDLLDRSDVDQIVRSMGIEGSLARAEILDQHRINWAKRTMVDDLVAQPREAPQVESRSDNVARERVDLRQPRLQMVDLLPARKQHLQRDPTPQKGVTSGLAKSGVQPLG